MGEHCEHGFAEGRRCPVCGGGGRRQANPKRRSVYEDRPVVEVVDEERRAEQLRAAGIGYGWRPLDQFLRGSPMSDVDRFAKFFSMLGYELEPFQREIVTECSRPGARRWS